MTEEEQEDTRILLGALVYVKKSLEFGQSYAFIIAHIDDVAKDYAARVRHRREH